ncbi:MULTISPECIES: TIGR04255 family protein [unclassified Streptomyces]|uniref:TIGR04255 family protein n=1 Tax=unclassified Streptomyces TaxID=2593676 RepID=UPI002256C6E6|nr:TIGR04255 family protein [Streptomyces sp. NBC_00340]MCX5138250.1 TIGR04255 family protein [Streptomyces sp. NBC_00340]
MYSGRESYARAPLSYVTIEISLSYEPRINETTVRDVFAEAVRDTFPLLQQEEALAVRLEEADDDIPSQLLPAMRAFTSDTSTSALLKASALTVETVAYSDHESFRVSFESALNGLQLCSPQSLIRRVGVRYVNEIRPPAQDGNWGKWVSPNLLGSPALLPGAKVAGSMGHVLYHLEEDYWTGFRWGEVIGTTIVDRNVPLQRKGAPPPENGHFFVLDIDSFWDPDEAVPLDARNVAEVIERLHVPAGQLFQASITEDAKQYFRGEEK